MIADESTIARIQAELELISVSLLPSERLRLPSGTEADSPSDNTDDAADVPVVTALPCEMIISSAESRYTLLISVSAAYPAKEGVKVQVKGEGEGRDEAEGWKEWVGGVMRVTEWDDSESGCVFVSH